MVKKIPFIQIGTALYVLLVALYMIFNKPTDFWVSYYWIVNKLAMFMALGFNYRIEKSKSEQLFINFLFIQTGILVLYYSTGLYLYKQWMKENDSIVYSFFVGGFLAVVFTWLTTLKKVKQKNYEKRN